LQIPFVQLHFDFLQGLMAAVMTWCASWMVHLFAVWSLYSPEITDCHMISNSGAMLATLLARYLITYLSAGIHQIVFFDPVDNSPATVAIRAPPVLAI
jgi:hypothetical protein